jgi:hypothetical protein
VPLRASARGDAAERQAADFARGRRLGRRAAPSGVSLDPGAAAAVHHGLAGSGRPLDSRVRGGFEKRLEMDLGAVRVHTGAAASAAAHTLGASAYAYGTEIAFGAGRYQPETADGSRLLAHELAHVAQQAEGAPFVAADVGDVFSAALDVVSPGVGAIVHAGGFSGTDLLYGVASSLFGETVATLIREWVIGFGEGLANAPSAQYERLQRKFDDFGPRQMASYVGGYLLGILEGLWHGIRGLVEAILMLLRIPQALFDFLTTTLPDLAVRYGPRLAQLLAGRGGLSARFAAVRAAFLRDPRGSLAMIQRLVDQARAAVLGMVRTRGRESAASFLSFLEESWYAIGERFGDIVGQVLFEVALAVATDLIGNIVREAAQLGARLAARVIGPVVDGLRSIGRLATQALEWVESIGRRMAGEAGEFMDAIRNVLREFRALFDEVAPEIEAAHPPTGPPTGPSFADLSSELGLEAPGTTTYRSTAAAAREARTSGLAQGRPGFFSYSTQGSVRSVAGTSTAQAAHVVPQAAYRSLRAAGRTVSEGRALTTFLERVPHRFLDQPWIDEWNAAVAAGRRITAGDVLDMVSRAITRAGSAGQIDAATEAALQMRLRTELFSELGLTPTSVIVP